MFGHAERTKRRKKGEDMQDARLERLSMRLGGISTLILALSEHQTMGNDMESALGMLATEVEEVRVQLLALSDAGLGENSSKISEF